MPARSAISYLSPAAREEVKRRLQFIQQNRWRVSGLVSNTARLANYSTGNVSLTLSGKLSNPKIINAAYQLVCTAMGLPDPTEMEGIFANGAVPEGVGILQAAYTHTKEAHGVFKMILDQIETARRDLESARIKYVTARGMLEAALLMPDGSYPDVLETHIREEMKGFLRTDTNPFSGSVEPLDSTEKLPGESDIDYTIRMLKVDGELNLDGTLPTKDVHWGPGEHIDEETGQVFVLPKD